MTLSEEGMTEVLEFDVLDRNEAVHRHLLLEASAGTGKTFAIENIVVRLLIEPREGQDSLLIENILIVTFTRLASRELKERVHSNLEKCLDFFKRWLAGEYLRDQFPDYLAHYAEVGEAVVRRAAKFIERALFSFDRSQIFTIHGFCWRMLKNYSMEAGISLDANSREDQSLSVVQLMQVVRDFLGRGILPSEYSPQQLQLIMKRVKKKSEQLQKDLLAEVNKGIEIESSPSFSELIIAFQGAMKQLQQKHAFKSEKIVEDFLVLAPSYNKINDRSGRVHPDKLAKAEQFAALFDRQEWNGTDLDHLIEEGLFFLEVFDPGLLKAKPKPLHAGSLHYPDLLTIIREELDPLISQARSEAAIFSRMASDCRKFVCRYQEQAEVFGHTELLLQMKKAVGNPDFAARVRNSFSAAIVDEFQDTDPVQWDVFSTLFSPIGSSNKADNSWKGYLHLVGDPKQSIYSFRQADIYTYLSAAERLGRGAHATLNTNFRSRSSLVDSLNILFRSASEPFSLPKVSRSLPYRDVLAGRKDDGLNGAAPCLQFWKVIPLKALGNRSKSGNSLNGIEKDFLFPAVAREILLLNEQNGIRFGQCAILIADRYQGSRVSNYLKKLNIPVKIQKGADLSFSSAVDEMRELLNGIMNYHSKSSLNVALACRPIGMTHAELVQLENEERLLPIMEQFHRLKKILVEFGFSRFYTHFMKSFWHADGKSVLERLLNQYDGLDFYREWQDLADLLINEEQSQKLSPQGVITFLDSLKELSCNEEEKIKVYVDPNEDGVSILTMHMSKGLEFEVVFALGLIKRKKQSEDQLIPLAENGTLRLCAVENQQDPRYRKFCEESDAEKMRQLYVALTRAREKLYVPIVIEENHKEVPIGCASPMDLLLAKLQRPKIDYKGLYERISSEDGSALASLVAENSTKMSLLQLDKCSGPLPINRLVVPPLLIPPREIHIPGACLTVQSFTSLSQRSPSTAEVLEQAFAEAVFAVPHDFSCEEKNEHTLPSGNNTGIMLHKIFEFLPFDSIRDLTGHDQLRPLITPFLKGSPFAAWEAVVAKIVFNSLKVSLGGAAGFCLADVNPKRIYRETEFFYPCDPRCGMFNQDTVVKSGYLKGVVDVFFEHQEKYYLLDWKSNWLGPTQDYYQPKFLEEAMKVHQYDLQAAIYREAFRRYLKIFDKRPFEEIWGGVYYMFVRGVGLVHCIG